MKIKKYALQKVLSLSLAGCSVLSVASPALATAIDVAGGSADVPVVVTAEAARFSVTAPTTLPISVDADGVVTTATDAKVINNSHGSVVVSDLAVTGINGWDVVDYDTDMSKEKVSSTKIGLSINDNETEDGGIVFDASSMLAMAGDTGGTANQLNLDYDAKLPAQATALTDVSAVNLVITVGWNTGGVEINPDVENGGGDLDEDELEQETPEEAPDVPEEFEGFELGLSYPVYIYSQTSETTFMETAWDFVPLCEETYYSGMLTTPTSIYVDDFAPDVIATTSRLNIQSTLDHAITFSDSPGLSNMISSGMPGKAINLGVYVDDNSFVGGYGYSYVAFADLYDYTDIVSVEYSYDEGLFTGSVAGSEMYSGELLVIGTTPSSTELSNVSLGLSRVLKDDGFEDDILLYTEFEIKNPSFFSLTSNGTFGGAQESGVVSQRIMATNMSRDVVSMVVQSEHDFEYSPRSALAVYSPESTASECGFIQIDITYDGNAYGSGYFISSDEMNMGMSSVLPVSSRFTW